MQDRQWCGFSTHAAIDGPACTYVDTFDARSEKLTILQNTRYNFFKEKICKCPQKFHVEKIHTTRSIEIVLKGGPHFKVDVDEF